MSKRVLILKTQNEEWEALYVDDLCVDQGHRIGESNRLALLEYAEMYNFNSEDIDIKEACDEDNDDADLTGNFPFRKEKLKGDYA